MDPCKKYVALSAAGLVVLGIALAFAVIAGIWLDFESIIVGKIICSLLVLFALNGVLHIIAKGMCETPKDKS